MFCDCDPLPQTHSPSARAILHSFLRQFVLHSREIGSSLAGCIEGVLFVVPC